MERLWQKLKAFLSESWREFEISAIYTSMWTDGYTEQEIAEILKQLTKEDKGS